MSDSGERAMVSGYRVLEQPDRDRLGYATFVRYLVESIVVAEATGGVVASGLWGMATGLRARD